MFGKADFEMFCATFLGTGAIPARDGKPGSDTLAVRQLSTEAPLEPPALCPPLECPCASGINTMRDDTSFKFSQEEKTAPKNASANEKVFNVLKKPFFAKKSPFLPYRNIGYNRIILARFCQKV